MKYGERFAKGPLQRSKSPLGYKSASRLLELAMTLAWPERVVFLKGAVAHERVLALEELIQAPLDLSKHLYRVDV